MKIQEPSFRAFGPSHPPLEVALQQTLTLFKSFFQKNPPPPIQEFYALYATLQTLQKNSTVSHEIILIENFKALIEMFDEALTYLTVDEIYPFFHSWCFYLSEVTKELFVHNHHPLSIDSSQVLTDILNNQLEVMELSLPSILYLQTPTLEESKQLLISSRLLLEKVYQLPHDTLFAYKCRLNKDFNILWDRMSYDLDKEDPTFLFKFRFGSLHDDSFSR